MACQVSSPQMGISVYPNDFKTRTSTQSSSPKPNRLRRNRPHPQKDFLLPSHIDDGIELQKRVRTAVREYLEEIYSSQGNSRSSSRRPPPQFIPPRHDDDLKPREILMPRASEKVYRSYPYFREIPNQQLRIAGRSTFDNERPSSTVVTERSPPIHLQGESKRDRSIRIREEIDKKNRAPTPSPQPKKWQRIGSAVPRQQKQHFTNPPQSKRALSAPPASKGYSYYKQSMKEESREDMHKPVQNQLRAWPDTANDYEKQVVYNMLSNATKPREGAPTTPPSPQEAYHMLLRAKSVPTEHPHPTTHDERNEIRTSWSPYFNDLRRQQTKQRNLNSAPVKPMLGLIPNATQYPHRDQRAYRLKEQDTRVMGNPDEERELKEYLSRVARVTQKQWRKPEKKCLIAPMHRYSDSKGSRPKDYKCDVSFFQSVRAPFKSHFVIHPDFSSETRVQKKRADQMVSHIRY